MLGFREVRYGYPTDIRNSVQVRTADVHTYYAMGIAIWRSLAATGNSYHFGRTRQDCTASQSICPVIE